MLAKVFGNKSVLFLSFFFFLLIIFDFMIRLEGSVFLGKIPRFAFYKIHNIILVNLTHSLSTTQQFESFYFLFLNFLLCCANQSLFLFEDCRFMIFLHKVCKFVFFKFHKIKPPQTTDEYLGNNLNHFRRVVLLIERYFI